MVAAAMPAVLRSQLTAPSARLSWLPAGAATTPQLLRRTSRVSPSAHLISATASSLSSTLTNLMTCAVATGACSARARQRRQRASYIATKVAGEGVSESRPQVIFVIGGPGSGKGTQCERIVEKFGFKHLSAGDLLRAERKREGSPLGKIIEETILAGGVVPSTIIAELLEKAMTEAGWADAKFVVDGYPRSAEQLKGWDDTLNQKVDFLFCVSLEVGLDEMRTRLLGRAASSGRIDDNEETITKRFVTFQKETDPLLQHFESKGLLRRVNGEQNVDEVWGEVQQLFEQIKD